MIALVCPRSTPIRFFSNKARVGMNVKVAELSFIGPEVTLEDKVQVDQFSVIQGRTVLGEGTHVYPLACVGGEPQSKKSKHVLSTVIGKRCMIREHVTVNAGTLNTTQVGNDVWLLAGCHVGHDARVGNSVVVSNASQIAGHVIVEDYCNLGGLSGIQQFCVVGRGSMIGGGAIVDSHVPPYSLVLGNRARFRGINIRGLRNRKIPNTYIKPLLRISREVYSSKDVTINAEHLLTSTNEINSEEWSLAKEFLEFIRKIGNVTGAWCVRRAALPITRPWSGV